MRFSKDSWHFRINSTLYGETFTTTYNWRTEKRVPRRFNLCTYFWITVLSIVIYLPFKLFMRIVKDSALSLILAVWFVIFSLWGFYDLSILNIPLAIFFFAFVWVILAVGKIAPRVIIWYDNRGYWIWENAPTITLPRPRSPSLLKEYLKAKKQKVCPIIEFVESQPVSTGEPKNAN